MEGKGTKILIGILIILIIVSIMRISHQIIMLRQLPTILLRRYMNLIAMYMRV